VSLDALQHQALLEFCGECTWHPGETVGHYCPLCDTPVCRDCALSPAHHEHAKNLLPLPHVFAEQRADMQRRTSLLRERAGEIGRSGAQLKHVERGILAWQTTLRARVHASMAAWVRTLEAHQQRILAAIDDMAAHKVSALQLQHKRLTASAVRLETVADEVSLCISKDIALIIFCSRNIFVSSCVHYPG
jgi:tripartite motif-containing protein 45